MAQVEVQAEFKSYRNKYNRQMQLLTFNNPNILNPTPSRDFWLSEADALEYLHELFNFENGKQYRIKYLVSQGWRSGSNFTKTPNTNLQNHVYNHAVDVEMYHNQALDLDDIHIFGIYSVETTPNDNIDWEDIVEY